jgi:hypothetical protein
MKLRLCVVSLFRPGWYKALIKSRQLEKALQDAAERMYRELTEQESASNGEGVPMTVDRWRKMKLEKKMRQADLEDRREMQRECDKPKVNVFGYAPLVEPAGLSAGDIRILKVGGAIFAVVILGIVAFLVVRV